MRVLVAEDDLFIRTFASLPSALEQAIARAEALLA